MTTLAEIEQGIRDCDEMTRVTRAAAPEAFAMFSYWCGSAGCVLGHVAVSRGFSFDGSQRHARYMHMDLGMDLLSCVSTYDLWDDDDRAFVFGGEEGRRRSAVDDAPFEPTPVEHDAMGERWAEGMAEREAALNRIGIVRAALVKWRDALVAAEKREAVTA